MRSVSAAVDKQINGGLGKMSIEEIRFLPLSFLKHYASYQVPQNFKKLPPTYALQLEDYQYCYIHYPSGRTQIDGPPSIRKYCKECSKNNAA